jgi:hypothetical protein
MKNYPAKGIIMLHIDSLLYSKKRFTEKARKFVVAIVSEAGKRRKITGKNQSHRRY